MFHLVSKYKPSGDQPQAIKKLVDGINDGRKHQVLLLLVQERFQSVYLIWKTALKEKQTTNLLKII